jgi:predicted deacylase
LIWSLAHGAFAQTRAGLNVGPISVQPGAKVSGTIQIPAGEDEATTIPISVIHGAQPGPTLALIAGNHGYEYMPIIALQRLLPRLAPKQQQFGPMDHLFRE